MCHCEAATPCEASTSCEARPRRPATRRPRRPEAPRGSSNLSVTVRPRRPARPRRLARPRRPARLRRPVCHCEAPTATEPRKPRRPVRPLAPTLCEALTWLRTRTMKLIFGRCGQPILKLQHRPVAVCAYQWTGATVFTRITTRALHARPTTSSTRTLTNFNALIRVRIRTHCQINRERVRHISSR